MKRTDEELRSHDHPGYVPEEGECSYNASPICPHCGYEMQDAWELGLDDGDDMEAECGRCGKKYRVTLYISVKYSTEKDGGADAC